MQSKKNFFLLCTFVFAVLLFSAPGVCRETVADSEPEHGQKLTAGRLFRSAFSDDTDPAEQKMILKEVIEKHGDSRWADDALWALGRLAEIEGRRAEAVLWYRRLTEEFSHPALEPFTESLQFYQTSALPRILHIVDAAGVRYKYDRGELLAFNPLPYVVHKHLGLTYRQMRYYGLAEREYRKAYRNLPDVDLLRNTIQTRIDMLQRLQGTAFSKEIQ